MTFAPLAPLAEIAWLAAGIAIGLGGVALKQRVLAWCEARTHEWDPY